MTSADLRLCNAHFFDLTDPANADFCRGWWCSFDRSSPPSAFQDRGNGPEPIDDGYFGPFASLADAEADLARYIAGIHAE